MFWMNPGLKPTLAASILGLTVIFYCNSTHRHFSWLTLWQLRGEASLTTSSQKITLPSQTCRLPGKDLLRTHHRNRKFKKLKPVSIQWQVPLKSTGTLDMGGRGILRPCCHKCRLNKNKADSKKELQAYLTLNYWAADFLMRTALWVSSKTWNKTNGGWRWMRFIQQGFTDFQLFLHFLAI